MTSGGLYQSSCTIMVMPPHWVDVNFIAIRPFLTHRISRWFQSPNVVECSRCNNGPSHQVVCKKQLFNAESNFWAKTSNPPPSLPLLLYAVHNSHNLCGKYLFLAVHIQIYFIIFSCSLELWVNMLGPERQYIGGQLQHHWLINGALQHVCDAWVVPSLGVESINSEPAGSHDS